jgi:uncharacterized protein YjgD (DUF1641 family)
MANPIAFKPPAVDPRTELNRRLDAAPTEHAEAMLVAWDILQSAHDQGVLDAFHGLITAKDTIFATLADYAKMPEGAAGIRNFIALTKMFATIDPDTLDHIAKSMTAASEEHHREEKPPSLWQLAQRASSEDSRRGLSFVTLLLSRFGRALKG